MKAELASPLTDPRRLEALRRTLLLDTPPEESFDRLARLAGRLLSTPIVLVSLVDEDRQFFKSCIGLSEPLATLREMPISYSFCRHAVDSASPLILEDAREHPLFRDNPSVAELGVVGYAGIPLITPEGHALGSFCVLDTRPRNWTAEQVEVLKDLAASVMTEIRLREGVFAAREQEAAESDARHRFESLVQGLDAIVYDLDVESLGFTFVSQRAEDLLGYPVRRWIEEPRFWQDVLLHPDDREWAIEFCRTATRDSRDHELEYRAVRANGEVVWLRELIRVVRDEGGRTRALRGVIIDISEQKLAEEARARAEGDARTMASRMRAVAGAAAGVIGADTLQALQHVLRDECARVMSFDTFTMALYDEADHTFAHVEAYDGDLWVPPEPISATGTPGERVIRTRRSLLTRRSDDPEAAGSVLIGTGRRSESIIRSPILAPDRVLGLLSVQSYISELYTEQDVEVLEAIASLAATALLNLELLAERETAQAALVRANEELEQRVAERTGELQQRTGELEQRTGELEAIFQALPDLYFRLSPEGMVLDYRAADKDRLLPPERFVGRTLTEMLKDLPEDAQDGLREGVERVNRTGELVCVEYPLPFGDAIRE
jgi:PAS domain S-box-containing protein